ncbi:hypothetical protein Tco_1284216 [Tanacetum coccineum]
MAEIKTKTTTEEFMTKNRANYYSEITSITVNGKAAYELKGKFLDDLRDNAFNGTNGEDALEMQANAKRDETNTMFEEWLDLKFANHMMMDPFTKKVLWDFWKKGDNQEGVIDEGFFNLEKANNDDEHEIIEIFRIETNLFDYETPLCTKFNEFNYLIKVNTELFTHDIQRTKTYKDYENELNNELDEPWSENGVPYEICDHICEPFRFKNGKAKWPTYSSNEDGLCNGGELLGMVRVGYMTYFQDHKWDHIRGPYANYYSNVQEEVELHKKEEICELFDNPRQEPPVCEIRRFEMIKYTFGQEEYYVAIKEYEYDDFTRTNEDACHAYQ